MSFYVEWGRLMARANLSDSRPTRSNLDKISGNTMAAEAPTASISRAMLFASSGVNRALPDQLANLFMQLTGMQQLARWAVHQVI